MGAEQMRAVIVGVLESAIQDTGIDEDDPLTRAAIIMQDDGSIAIATWSGNLFLVTVQDARAVVCAD